MSKHTPGPWRAVDRVGAGWQIDAILPKGFKIQASLLADGNNPSMLFTARERIVIQIADERWVQFETAEWKEVQAANAALIAAAPDLLEALRAAREAMKANEEISGTWDLYQHSPEMRLINAVIAKAEGRRE
jgi:hypothetical protein